MNLLLRYALLPLSLTLLCGCASLPGPPRTSAETAAPARIAIGSCLQQGKPQPIWTPLLEARPDLFIFMGDNIYGDTEDMAVMREKYELLGSHPGYRALRDLCPVLATWDDHDYGVNDGGAEYPMKNVSKEEFLRFFEIPESDPLYSHPGIYRSRSLSLAGLQVQVLLLDTRTFRGPLTRVAERVRDQGPYQPVSDPSVPLLGEAQWNWLASELKQPADLRILVSSIQVIPEDHQWEKWMNLPHERERLLNLLRDTGAAGVIVISGDRHHGGLSKMNAGIGYPLYELTASGMNRAMKRPIHEKNRHAVAGPYLQNHFGLIRIDPAGKEPVITLELINEEGVVVLSHSTSLSTLHPSATP